MWTYIQVSAEPRASPSGVTKTNRSCANVPGYPLTAAYRLPTDYNNSCCSTGTHTPYQGSWGQLSGALSPSLYLPISLSHSIFLFPLSLSALAPEERGPGRGPVGHT